MFYALKSILFYFWSSLKQEYASVNGPTKDMAEIKITLEVSTI